MTTLDHLAARAGNAAPGKLRLAPAVEGDLRTAFLAGDDIHAAGRRHGLTPGQVDAVVRYRRTRWEAGEAERRAYEAKGRIVVMKPFARKTGSFDWRPISLPYVSMHAAALAEASQ